MIAYLHHPDLLRLLSALRMRNSRPIEIQFFEVDVEKYTEARLRAGDEYKQILNRKKVGCFEVPMVHTAVLVNLQHEESDLLTYNPDNIPGYPGPEDDIIVFALSASLRSIPLHICNGQHFGVLSLPLEEGQSLSHETEILRYTLSELTARNLPIVPTSFPDDVLMNIPEANKMGFDEIFLINLNRRVDRYERMA